MVQTCRYKQQQLIVRISLSVKSTVTNLSIRKKLLERSNGGIVMAGISIEPPIDAIFWQRVGDRNLQDEEPERWGILGVVLTG